MQGRTGRIVVYCRLGTLGSVNSLLCGVKRCENDYQPFSLSFQIRTVEPKGPIGSNPRSAPPKERKNGIPNGIPEVTAGYAFGRYARLPLTSKLDAVCAAYVNRLSLHLRFAKPSSNPRPTPPKEKIEDTTRVSSIFWRCRPDLNRRITVLQTGALPLGYCTKFLIALIL